MDSLDWLALLGLALIAYGLALIWQPLAPIGVGVLILAAVVYRARQGVVSNGDNDKPGGRTQG